MYAFILQTLRDYTAVPLSVDISALLKLTYPQLIAALAALLYHIDFLQSSPYIGVEEYDFIVVGGGSSGSVIANRLSKDYRVLLLEAGGDPNPLTLVPAIAMANMNWKETDWQYRTEPQNNSFLSSEEQRSLWNRGKSLGGSSNLNFMIYQRGHPRDFEQLAEATGDPQWNYKYLLPFFKMSENYHGHYRTNGANYHGHSGPLYVGKAEGTYQGPEFLAAAQEMGYDERDLNAEQRPGFSLIDFTIKKGIRWSTYSAFLHNIRNRKNLVIYRYARVVKIHIDKTKRATGVSYVRHNVTKIVKANREVIVSAGAIDSPKLLLLSGIGAAEHLKSVGIDCLVDLPGVGQNLLDHVMTILGPFLINATSLLVDRDFSLNAVENYVNNGKGVLASPFGLSGVGVIPSTLASDKTWPDLYFLLMSMGVYRTFPDDLTRTFVAKKDFFHKYLNPHLGRDSNFVVVMLGKPKSRGGIYLASANPWEKPIIQPNYFSHPDDVKRLVEGMRFTINLYENTTAFRRLDAHLATNSLPGCEHLEFKSDAYLECYLRQVTMTLFHPCGTCAMGMGEGDPEAVVDSHLRVRNVRGLRVADASVLRHITNANLNAPAIVIGEKAAFLIKQYWAEKKTVDVFPGLLDVWSQRRQS